MMRQIGFCCALLWVSAWASASMDSNECEVQFAAGNTAYEAGDFSTAAKAYEAVLQDCKSFESEYNLGNAYYKLGQLGPCILHYERALQLKPTNEDARNNLKLAMTKVIDRVEPLPTQGLRDVWERVVAKGRLSFWSSMLLLLWLAGFGALSWRLFAREESMKRIASTLASVLLSLSVGVACLYSAAASRDDQSHEAVILKPTVEVRNAPKTDNSLVLFILHEGTKGRILSFTEGWVELELANGSVGWIPREDLAEI